MKFHELSKTLQLDRNTVERYLDLFSKVFIITRIGGYSKNLRKGVTKSSKWYFLDNGIRNALINNFLPMNQRTDTGALWANYLVAERLKYNSYTRRTPNIKFIFAMDAIVDTLYRSTLFNIHDFRCQCVQCHVSKTEYQQDFSIAYIRSGNFLFKSFKTDLGAHNELFLISKSGFEYKVGRIHAMPDQCTIFSISAENLEYYKALDNSFKSFVRDPNRHSMLVNATRETEYLHHCIFTSTAHCTMTLVKGII